MREGLGASARAMATRCCSPPESWPGKCVSRCERPTSAERARAASNASSRSRNSSGSATFSMRRHGGHEVEGLKHDADIGGAEARETVLVERR